LFSIAKNVEVMQKNCGKERWKKFFSAKKKAMGRRNCGRGRPKNFFCFSFAKNE
jgi:hypothetical protein